MGKTEEVVLSEADLDWIQMKKDFDSMRPETTREKMLRKMKSNPVVPIGCLATAGALGYGLYNFRTGNRKMSQMMMRTRIGAQAFTLVALIVGVVFTYKKE
ncbi:HIG1 domain family member 2A, mitochondrial [Episyrphus balteatus]|uniref:HIG1 domain family member 2A, mitochondrial n=1 Tax=Episyrphus balteatus TaxID=286459 RepID=UPI002484DAC3|nr:HIG1 domain family member 2A, mitochondrial [Episyrphus balteatus]